MDTRQREDIFAAPRSDVRFEDCLFYHTVDIPGRGVVHGQWDLRKSVDEYLGRFPFAGKRVLEIGPASGFLTMEMEKRGADVVALEVLDEPGWDFVPYDDPRMAGIFKPRAEHMRRIKDSFWFLHAAHHSKAKIYYGDSCNLPDALGHFDVAVMASVLLHCERPARIIAECAKRSDAIIITEIYRKDLEPFGVCRFVPDRANFAWDTWWDFSTTFFVQLSDVLGFHRAAITHHTQTHESLGPAPFFTIVAQR
jgi:SAM-dependent methyltransferase